MTADSHPGAAATPATGAADDRVTDAVRRAREVVGLYGDPDVTWGISLALTYGAPLDLIDAPARLGRMVEEHPHVGVAPQVERVADADWERTCEEVASTELGDDGRLVRLLVDESGTRVFVTVHHGVSDGLGQLALAEVLVGRPVRSSARGIGDRESQQKFLLSSVVRLGEALVRPPTRFAGTGAAPARTPDTLLARTTAARRLNGATAAHALARAHALWPRGRTSGGRRFLVVMGASRREPGTSAPDRQTAYFRIPLSTSWPLDRVERAVRSAEPEPAFPETSAGGIGPLVTKALKNRLGCTVNVSNLGVLSSPGLVSAAMYPALSGPMAVGVGIVSTAPDGDGAGGTSTVSLRTRRTDFTEAEASALLELVDQHLPAPT